MKDASEDKNDEEVLKEVLGGNRERYGSLVRRYQSRVIALGLRFFRNRDDALDFAQEVFVRAYERLASFRGESRFVTWLMKVAYYHGISAGRTRRESGGFPKDYEPEAKGRTPEDSAMSIAAEEALAGAVRDLPDRYRLCVELYFYFGMSYEDIVWTTDIPLGTVKSHVFRAKKALRRALRGTAAEDYHGM
jgi:RNA polymerase sigma-70 factor (ECF subfamily)